MLARAMRWSLVLTLVAGCSSSRPPRSASGPVTSPTAPAGIECDGDDEVNQDDDSAAKGLLLVSQLPPGDWTLAVTPPCSWALSGDEILAVPECRSAASAANAAPSTEARNGNAHRTFGRSDGTQVDVRVEIYTSRQNVDAIRAMLVGPSAPACYAAAVRDRAEREPATAVDDVRVAPIADLPGPAELDLGFPAVAGYAADAGFVSGVDVSLTRTT